MGQALELIRLLGDATRLRLISLLRNESLSVVEIQEILSMGQSRISSHLALLKQADLVTDRREGKKSYYSFAEPKDARLREICHGLLNTVAEEERFREDAMHLERILGKRRAHSEAYFNMVAERLGKNYCPGRSWEAIGHFLLLLTPQIDIVDLGAGEGVLSQLLARRARSVICVDNAPAMVRLGSRLAKENDIANLSYQLGDIEKIPLADACADLALLSQALHHARHPERAIAEAMRILRPGGRLVILDLQEHDFEKARELYADQWLGFSANQLYAWLKQAGFHEPKVEPVAREEQPPNFVTLLATGIKPCAPDPTTP